MTDKTITCENCGGSRITIEPAADRVVVQSQESGQPLQIDGNKYAFAATNETWVGYWAHCYKCNSCEHEFVDQEMEDLNNEAMEEARSTYIKRQLQLLRHL